MVETDRARQARRSSCRASRESFTVAFKTPSPCRCLVPCGRELCRVKTVVDLGIFRIDGRRGKVMWPSANYYYTANEGPSLVGTGGGVPGLEVSLRDLLERSLLQLGISQ